MQRRFAARAHIPLLASPAGSSHNDASVSRALHCDSAATYDTQLRNARDDRASAGCRCGF